MTTLRNDVLNTESARKLKSYFDRTMRLMDDRDETNTDIGVVMKEAKDDGFDTKILRKVIAKRRRDESEVSEEEALMEVYESALQGDLFEGAITMQVGDSEPVDITKAMNRNRRAAR